MWKLKGEWEWKLVQMSRVTWPTWPPCPYMLKTWTNLLLQNQLIDDLETWYVALSMPVLPRLFKLWPWIDLDLFYIKVKFGYIGFCMGESDFFFHSTKWVNEVAWVSKVKVILWPWSKVIQISKLNVWLWPVYSGERFRASWPSCFSRGKKKNTADIFGL